jgi:hypothetical protein
LHESKGIDFIIETVEIECKVFVEIIEVESTVSSNMDEL